MLNFCRWKRFFQQYPDQSAQPNGAGDMHKKLSEELGAKFPAITRGFSMVKFAHLDDAFFEVFWRQASPLEGQSLQQKEKKR